MTGRNTFMKLMFKCNLLKAQKKFSLTLPGIGYPFFHAPKKQDLLKSEIAWFEFRRIDGATAYFKAIGTCSKMSLYTCGDLFFSKRYEDSGLVPPYRITLPDYFYDRMLQKEQYKQDSC